MYVDDRGDIHRLRVGGQRINLLHTVDGAMRSGYLHPHKLYHTVISGKVEVWTLTNTGTRKTVYEAYDHFTIAEYVPHILYFLEPTTLAEWWDADVHFSCYYYHPYRKILDVQNSIFATTTTSNSHALGHHQYLIPQDQLSTQGESKSYRVIGWMTFAAMVGAAIGAFCAVAAKQKR